MEVDIKPLVEDQSNQTFFADRANADEQKAMFHSKKIIALIIILIFYCGKQTFPKLGYMERHDDGMKR